MFTSINFGFWEFWDYNPTLGFFGSQKVTFDGVNRLILINAGETEIDVKEDIYSNWKEWTRVRDNSKFPTAITVIGGEAIGAGTFVGATYFLENGWRIKPYQGNYIISFNGNIYTRESGGNPVIPTSGVSANFVRSSIVASTLQIAPSTDLSEVLVATNEIKAQNTTIQSNTSSLISTGNATLDKLIEVWKVLGLDPDNPQTITDASITVGGITITIAQPDEDTTTVTRS